MKNLLKGFIRLYRWGLSPLFAPRCRFYPSCSAYMMEVLEKYSFWKALGVGGRRLLKCHPLHPGGVDLP